MNLSPNSVAKLNGVHPDLVKVVMRAAELFAGELMVVEGVRTLAKQKEYFAKGKSKTMRSRHVPEVNALKIGCAVDLAPIVDTDGDGDMELTWEVKHFLPILKAMKQASKELKIPIECGGDWATFKDYPHHQLPWDIYP